MKLKALHQGFSKLGLNPLQEVGVMKHQCFAYIGNDWS